jgi:hypothetical protein
MAALSLLISALQVWGDDFEQEPIRYSDTQAQDPVAKLQERLESGKVQLEYEEHFGYLRAVLRELRVPAASQMLVFSKTSLQRQRIAPRTPRALYFNDDTYVGFCHGGDMLELSAVDPELGAVFYTLDQQLGGQPRLVRQGDSCLICHGASQTQGVPGYVVRSVYPDAAGFPILSSGTHRIDHTSPLERRWGGWYVTGTHGTQPHLGNLLLRSPKRPEEVDNAAGMNLTDLGKRFDQAAYLTGHSDIVALMVLEHQAEAHNLLTRANHLTRQALHHETALNRELNYPADKRWESTISRLRSASEPLIKYLLFSGEAALTGPIRGTSGFAEEFPKQGPRDDQGRSLRDFDLERRIFKYPCSYLIYSPSFEALPVEARDYVYRRMWEILNGREMAKEFAHLSAADRQAILEILQATKPNLPDYWRKAP